VEGASGRAPLLGNPKDEFFLEICKMLYKRASFSIGALLGKLERVLLPRRLREMNLSTFLGPGGYSDFKSELDLGFTQTNISGFLLFGPRGY